MPTCHQCGDDYPELYGPLDATTGDLCLGCYHEAVDLIACEAADPATYGPIVAIVIPDPCVNG